MSLLGDFFQDLLGIEEPETETGVEFNKSSNIENLPVIYGTQRVEGTRVFVGAGGTNNDFLYMVIALCEGEVDSITDIRIDDKPLAEFPHRYGGVYPSLTTVTDTGAIVVRKYLGTDAQVADTMMTAAFSQYGSTHKLSGVAYLACRFKWSSGYYTKKPKVTAVVRGKKVYDPRDSGTRWSDNPALCLRDYLTNSRYGKGLSSSLIDDTSFIAAANDCDSATTLVYQINVGSPDNVVAEDNELYLVWDAMPTDVAIIPSGNVQDDPITPTKVAYMSSGGFNTMPLGDVTSMGGFIYLSVTMTTGSDFTTGDTIYLDAEAVPRITMDATIDTSQTLFENVKTMLAGMRGILAYQQGTYQLLIEQDKASVFDFDESHIVGGFSISGPEKKSKFNRVTVKFTDPNSNWQENIAVFPEAGTALETALIAEDNGAALHKEITLSTVGNYYRARDAARILLYKSRSNLRLSFNATSEAIEVTVGDIVTVTHASPGWSSKEFLVTKMDLLGNGEVALDMVEHSASIYTYYSVSLQSLKDDNTNLPNPFSVTAPTNLVATDSTVTELDGSRNPALTVTFDGSADGYVAGYEVQYKVSTDTPYNSIITQDTQTVLAGLALGLTYDIRVRAINSWDKKSAFLAIQKVLAADTTGPGAYLGVNSTSTGYSHFDISITPPSDLDYSHAQVYVSTTNSQPVSPTIVNARGTVLPVSGLAPETLYYYWVEPVDTLGNTGTVWGSNSVTTQAHPGGAGNRMLPRYAGGWKEEDLTLPLSWGTDTYVSYIGTTTESTAPTAGYYGDQALKIRSKAGASDAYIYFGSSETTYSMSLDPNSDWLFRCKAWAETANTTVQARIRTKAVGSFYTKTKELTTAETWLDWEETFVLSSDASNFATFRLDVDEDDRIVWFDGLMLEKKTSNQTVAGTWTPPPAYSIGGAKVATNQLAAGVLDAGITANDGTGAAREIAKGVEVGYASDGDAITFSQQWESVPAVVFMPGGITSDSGLGADQHLVAEAIDVTVSGFTARIVLRDAATSTSTWTDSVGAVETVTDTTWDMPKYGSALAAWDDRYTFQFDVTVQNRLLGTNWILGGVYESGTVRVGIYVSLTSGVWTKVGESLITGGFTAATTTVSNVIKTVSVDGLTQHAGYEFRVKLESSQFDGSSIDAFDSVTYETATVPSEVSATPAGVPPVQYMVIGS